MVHPAAKEDVCQKRHTRTISANFLFSPQKRTPGHPGYWGFERCCCHNLGFCAGRQGCRGMWLLPSRPNSVQNNYRICRMQLITIVAGTGCMSRKESIGMGSIPSEYDR